LLTLQKNFQLSVKNVARVSPKMLVYFYPTVFIIVTEYIY